MGALNPGQEVCTGLDCLQREEEWRKKLKGYRLGLLANQASVDGSLIPSKDVIAGLFPGQLKALFGPQHGYLIEDQDNMMETGHGLDRDLGIPIFSLYADYREPLPYMLEMIDVLIVDLQDVGTRVYTFASTMLNCLMAAAKAGRKKVLVLDRPNPLGGEIVEGNLLRPEYYSFVGPYSLPMRHGLTMGEMALLFNSARKVDADVEVVPMAGWRRAMDWYHTGLRWVMPSPNMPSAETALVYPGQVLLEGTNLSEGRGTCRPFEIFGAPYVDTAAVMEALEPGATSGCCLQRYTFRPMFQKWEGELCRGFMIHVIDAEKFRPFRTTLALLGAVLKTHQENFCWKAPPYEYEFKMRPIDVILGEPSILDELESGAAPSMIVKKNAPELEAYKSWREPYLLYQ